MARRGRRGGREPVPQDARRIGCVVDDEAHRSREIARVDEREVRAEDDRALGQHLEREAQRLGRAVGRLEQQPIERPGGMIGGAEVLGLEPPPPAQPVQEERQRSAEVRNHPLQTRVPLGEARGDEPDGHDRVLERRPDRPLHAVIVEGAGRAESVGMREHERGPLRHRGVHRLPSRVVEGHGVDVGRDAVAGESRKGASPPGLGDGVVDVRQGQRGQQPEAVGVAVDERGASIVEGGDQARPHRRIGMPHRHRGEAEQLAIDAGGVHEVQALLDGSEEGRHRRDDAVPQEGACDITGATLLGRDLAHHGDVLGRVVVGVHVDRARGAGRHDASSQSRMAAPCWSRAGGAPWARRVTSSPGCAKKRSGGPGRSMVPSVAWSTSIRSPCEASCGHA